MEILSLLWTTEQFLLEGIAYAGLPLFVRSESMRIEFLPTEFCLHVAIVRGRARSKKTWKAYGYELLAFIRFMESAGFGWHEPNEEYLAHYRTSLERRNLVRPTIARIMNRVCQFYEWAHAKGYIANLPFTREVVQIPNRGLLAHIEETQMSSRAILIPRVVRRRRHPRYFTREEQERLYAELAPRDQLILDWAVYTGAREFELSDLTTDILPPPSAYRSRKSFALEITRKGGALSDLYVPTWLLNRTYQYVTFYERADVFRSSQKRAGTASRALFLGRWGRKLQPDSIYKTFRAALKRAGLRGHFHDLRHTFAISTMHRLMQLPRHKGTDGLNALVDLRNLMGHQSVTTTMKYLEAWKFYMTEIYSDLYEIPERYKNG